MTTLHITKTGTQFMVDDPTQPGSPPVGYGRTMKEAIGDWLISNQTKLGIDFDVTQVEKTENQRRRRELAKR